MPTLLSNKNTNDENYFTIERDENGCVLIQRDGTYFHFILSFMTLRRDWEDVKRQFGGEDMLRERLFTSTGIVKGKIPDWLVAWQPYQKFMALDDDTVETTHYELVEKIATKVITYGQDELMMQFFVMEIVLKAKLSMVASIGLLKRVQEEAQFYCVQELADGLEIFIQSTLNPFDLLHGMEEKENVKVTKEVKSFKFEVPVEKARQERFELLKRRRVNFVSSFNSVTMELGCLLPYKKCKFFELALVHLKKQPEAENVTIHVAGNDGVTIMLKFIKYGKLELEDWTWAENNKLKLKQLSEEFNFEEFYLYINHCFATENSLKEVIGEENFEMRQSELIRELFISHREDESFLKESNNLLIPVFENLELFQPSMDILIPEEKLLFNFEKSFNIYNRKYDAPVRPEIVRSREEFEFNFKIFTQNLLNGLNYENIVIAGGCIQQTCMRAPSNRTLIERFMNYTTAFAYEGVDVTQIDKLLEGITSWKFDECSDPELNMKKYYEERNPVNGLRESDVDIFIHGLNAQDAMEKIRHIVETIKNNSETKDVFLMRSGQAITIRTSKTVRSFQIILRLYKNISEVLCGFDVDSCCFAFDGANVFSTPRGRRALVHRYNMVDTERQSYTYEQRLVKYAKRGFRIFVPFYNPNHVKREGLLHPMQSEISLSIKRIPQPSYGNCRGLAFLLLQERRHLCEYKLLSRFFKPQRFNYNMNKKLGDKLSNDKSIFNESDYGGRNFLTYLKGLENMTVQTMKEKYDNLKKQFNRLVNANLAYSYLANSFKFIYAVNDLDYIFNDASIHAMSFVTENPGSQTRIGSFMPHERNFYEDAYFTYKELLERKIQDSQGRELGKIKILPLYWIKFSYEDVHKWTMADEYDQRDYEKCYQEFLRSPSHLSDCGIDFHTMRHYGKDLVARDLTFKYVF